MAGSRIPGLTALTGALAADTDQIVIYDLSADITKRMDLSELAIAIAADIPFTPVGSVAATTLAGAVAELAQDTINFGAVSITGGSIDGTIIGATAAAAATFTTLVANSATFTDLALVNPLPILEGGTGADNAAGARGNLGAAASGANTDITSIGASTTINGQVIGYRRLPSTSNASPTAGDLAFMNEIGSNITVESGRFVEGDWFILVNTSAASIQIIQGAGVTLRLSGTASTGSRTVPERGIAGVLCLGAEEFHVFGPGVS